MNNDYGVLYIEWAAGIAYRWIELNYPVFDTYSGNFAACQKRIDRMSRMVYKKWKIARRSCEHHQTNCYCPPLINDVNEIKDLIKKLEL